MAQSVLKQLGTFVTKRKRHLGGIPIELYAYEFRKLIGGLCSTL